MAVAVVAALIGVAGVVALTGQAPVVVVGTHTWLDDAPVVDRGGAAAVWTGTEYLVIGGDTAATEHITASGNTVSSMDSITMSSDGEVIDDPSVRSDAHALDPSTREWRRLADAPFPVEHAATAWTGDEAVVVDWKRVAVYAPTTDTWRRLPDLEHGVEPWASTAVVAGMVVLTGGPGGSGDLTVIDPASGTTANLTGDAAVFHLLDVGGDLVVVRDRHDERGDEVIHTWIVDRVPGAILREVLDAPGADPLNLDRVVIRVAEVPGSARGDGAVLVVGQEQWHLLTVTEDDQRVLEVHDVTPGTAAELIARSAWQGRLPTGPFERGPLLTRGDWVLGAWSPLEAWRLGDDGVEVGRVDQVHVGGEWPELTVSSTAAGGPAGSALVVMGGGPPVLVEWAEPGAG